jgi:alpha-beta hydrolase superfamily lysophospholipase
MLFDHPIISQRYFFPRAGRPSRGLVEVDVEGATLCCAQNIIDPEGLTLLHFHGNGEVVADYVPWLMDLFARMGLNTFFAEYRGYGGSSGVPLMAGMLEDVVPLLEASGSVPEKTIVMGRSVGSIYAIELAHRRPGIGGLILESGIADPLERILLRARPEELGTTAAELSQEARLRFDHQLKLRAFINPMLVLHARGDDLVSSSHAERNHTWAASKHKRLALLENGDHNSIMQLNQQRYFEEIAELVEVVRAGL